MRSIRARGALALLACAVLAGGVVACGGDDSSSSGGSATKKAEGPVTLTWWHNGTSDPLKGVWQQAAAGFHAANPDVTMKVEPIQNEQFSTKVPLALQSSDPPSIYQQWGGGQMASQIPSGKVMDITSAAKPWINQVGTAAGGWQVDGKQYGVPFSLHVVGFWYRKDLFDKAGITAPPKTIDELNADIGKLKSAGIVPVAIGGKDRWPDAFWWEYFALRECSTDTLKTAMKNQDLSDGCFAKASEDMQKFLDTKPFQTGFLGTPAQQGAGSSAGMVANGKAAMELQGTWEPATMAPLTSDKKLNSKLGWFPFPAVEGGQGDPDVALGGGDGFSCTTEATNACVEFLKYVTGTDVQKKLVSSGAAALPVNAAAASAIKDPTVKTVQDFAANASYIQTYFDIALPTSAGQALDDAVANFFAGKGDGEAIVKSVNE
jgi:raffinose/stachyose/melibiose transport system substrate-binding protein